MHVPFTVLMVLVSLIFTTSNFGIRAEVSGNGTDLPVTVPTSILTIPSFACPSTGAQGTSAIHLFGLVKNAVINGVQQFGGDIYVWSVNARTSATWEHEGVYLGHVSDEVS